ncbi:glutaredoxin family protein [Oceanihabitans sediminis]|uniref:glutaredoxin family protein n=1 Tax=Oceanihabitans sediminis TaxID=1812012 RepID=UPI003A929607
MNRMYLLILLLFFPFFNHAQNEHEFVSIKEKVTGKRVELFAINTNDISYDVFLKVNATGFRRSSSRPIIKNVPANSKVRMLTLIKLDNVASSYNYTLVVNEISVDLKIQKDKTALDLKIDKSLNSKTVTLFTKDNCLLCNQTKDLLRRNKISYEEYNIDKDSTYLIKLIKEFKLENTHTKTQVPIIKVEDSLYSDIKTQNQLIKKLRKHYQ